MLSVKPTVRVKNPGKNASLKKMPARKYASWKKCLLEIMPPEYFVTRKKWLLRKKIISTCIGYHTTSTLTVRNGQAVTHHISYDRPVEKEMGSARCSASY